eukprot:PRCOL_00005230-RA
MVEISGKTMMKVGAVASAGYSAQFLLAPKTSHDMYFTEKVPYGSSQAAIMGHALGGAAAVMASCAENPTKGNLRAVGGFFLTGPLLILREKKNGNLKTDMFVPNLVMTTALGSACLIAANKMK